MSRKQPQGTMVTLQEIKCSNGFRFSLSKDEIGMRFVSVTDGEGRWSSVAHQNDGDFTDAEIDLIKEIIEGMRKKRAFT